jgi:hypothetical protein
MAVVLIVYATARLASLHVRSLPGMGPILAAVVVTEC